jgi:hypothetical protein
VPSTITGHSHASLAGHAERAARFHSDENDRTKLAAAITTVISTAAARVTRTAARSPTPLRDDAAETGLTGVIAPSRLSRSSWNLRWRSLT